MASLQTRQSMLQAARSGDPQAWQRLIDLYRPLIAGWGKRHTTLEQDAEDLAQEILLELTRYLPRFEHNGRAGAFRAWLRTLAVHCTTRFWSAKKLHDKGVGGSAMLAALNELNDPDCALTQSWDREHDLFIMNQLLEQVALEFEPQSMTVFRRQALDGAAAEDVATEMNLSVGAVYTIKSRVLKRLRELSEGLLEWED